jgi:hypothetical protein
MTTTMKMVTPKMVTMTTTVATTTGGDNDAYDDDGVGDKDGDDDDAGRGGTQETPGDDGENGDRISCSQAERLDYHQGKKEGQ